MHQQVEAMFDLSGRCALITGGASKLGYDAASVLAAAGANVIVTSRDASKAEQSAQRLAADFGVKALGLALDQSRYAAVAAMAERALEWSKGEIDVLVNNGGGGSGGSIAKLFERDPADIDAMLQTNLNGVLYCCREIGKAMRARGSGSIINIASIAALIGRDRRDYDANGLLGQPVDYAASKAGVLGLTRDMAAYVAPMGVRVNAISPGGFERPDMVPGFVRAYSNKTPMGRMGKDGEDLKGAILFLASPASGYITGQNIVVDGGFSIFR
ncbi:SDR family oxidoreductase [Devosia sp. YIM 151766]|uniref:SDR family oxidoreductase n=1 Tax=Devosia sp. YIM 151766 TaxID=3017325 RepID=UPI00255CAE22|nr:SDR family oxidoreductase [Devosia sp. YIM 151766]WIY53901.1 SDR family oxidoreductase [Devosia sp. YIM 151766]